MRPGAARDSCSPREGELGAKGDTKAGRGRDLTVKGTVPSHPSKGSRAGLSMGATVSCESRKGRQIPPVGCSACRILTACA